MKKSLLMMAFAIMACSCFAINSGDRVLRSKDNPNNFAEYHFRIDYIDYQRIKDPGDVGNFIAKDILHGTGGPLIMVANNYVFKMLPGEWEPVGNMATEQVQSLREKKGDSDTMYPNVGLGITVSPIAGNDNFSQIEVAKFIDMDNGLAAGESMTLDTYYFDCKRKTAVKLADIFTPESNGKLLDMIKARALSYGDEKGIMDDLVNELTQVPERFEFDELMFAFRFGKYEIAAGNVGEATVDFPIVDLLPYLTPLGRKLMAKDLVENPDPAIASQVQQRAGDFLAKCLDYSDNNNVMISGANFTKDYNAQFELCNKHAQQLDGEMSWLNFDPWIDAQDYQDVSYKLGRTLVRNANMAMTEVEITNMGNTLTKQILWKREGGKWLIDNFTTSATKMRIMMRDFLK